MIGGYVIPEWRDLLREEADIVLAPASLRWVWTITLFCLFLLARDDLVRDLTPEQTAATRARLDQALSEAGEPHPYYTRRWLRETAASYREDQPALTALRSLWPARVS